MKTLFLIAARGGSKGVPRKNNRKIGGIPLVAYKIIAAQRSGVKGRIIVSTDDDEIAQVSKDYGAEVPFMRPDYLATDSASSLDVVDHALQWIDTHDRNTYDYICLLEPSSPFASGTDLHNALETIQKADADTLLGMKEVDVARCFIWPLDENGGLSLFYRSVQNLSGVRRQEQKTEYTMNGCMYIAKTDYYREHKSFHSENSVPYIMPIDRSIEIDTMQEFHYAEYCVKEGFINIDEWK